MPANGSKGYSERYNVDYIPLGILKIEVSRFASHFTEKLIQFAIRCNTSF